VFILAFLLYTSRWKSNALLSLHPFFSFFFQVLIECESQVILVRVKFNSLPTSFPLFFQWRRMHLDRQRTDIHAPPIDLNHFPQVLSLGFFPPFSSKWYGWTKVWHAVQAWIFFCNKGGFDFGLMIFNFPPPLE